MCKIFAMTNLDKVKVNPELIDTIRTEVCKLSDKDGFGYAVMDKYGAIGGERTIREATFMAMKKLPPSRVTSNLPIVIKNKEAFGRVNFSIASSLIAHGRFSTNEIALQNTHPFYNGKVALIHNGVVDDATDSVTKELTTTCDTEILLRYWERGGFDEIPKNVAGYYAMAVLDKTGLLHIVRDGKASLYIAWSPSVDSYLIATTSGIIDGVAAKMGWKIEEPLEIIENTYSVFKGNELLSHVTFKPRTEAPRYRGSRSYGSGSGWNHWDGAFGSHDYDGYEGRGYGSTYTTQGGVTSSGSTPSQGPLTLPAPESNKTETNATVTDSGGIPITTDEEPQNLVNLGDFKKIG